MRKPLFEELERRILMSADIPALLDPSLATGGDPVGQHELVQDTDAAAQLDRHELVFVDTSIEDYEVLVDDLRSAIPEGRSLEVILLDRERDGIEQITDFLNDYEGLDAIHIVSHGDEGAAQLGSGWLTGESLDGYATSIASWSDALSDDADLLFYGCNLAGGESGTALIESLSKLTGADVAASENLTGGTEVGGDWTLEVTTGQVETSLAFSSEFQQGWSATLATQFTVSTTADSGLGSLRQAIIDANASANAGEPDVIAFDIGADGSQQTINLLSALDPISESVVIDGFSQYGALTPAGPILELNGAGTSGADGLTFVSGSDGSTIQGLLINQFDDAGIKIVSSDNNIIAGNYIGTDGTSDLGNGTYGVEIQNSSGNTIGGTSAADRNVISGNNDSGIMLYGAGTTGTVVQGNYIGTNATGSSDIGNTWDGIVIRTSASNNTIGGTLPAERNVISGNGEDGIFIGFDAFSNTVSGNYIGTDAAGTTDIANARYGVTLYNGVNNNTIGGTPTGAGNVISGNANSGIVIDGAGGSTTDNNVIQGNYIGTDKDGTTALGNGGEGIDIFNGADTNTVGGSLTGARNIISGNAVNGIHVNSNGSDDNVIKGNYIGTDVTGLLAIGNGKSGVNFDGGANSIVGGTTAAERNVISGNLDDGVEMDGGSAHTIQGNYIGVGSDGTTALGNGGIGVKSSVSNITIGGTAAGAGNIIANQLASGAPNVWVMTGTTGVSILGNSIYNSDSIGIELGPSWGVTPNDVGDGDDVSDGPNNLQNFPVLSTASTTGSQILITGSLNSTANSYYRIEFFANTSGDASGYGEGETYLGYANVTTDGSGNTTINVNLTASVASGAVISATATKTDATYTSFTDTSEFAANIVAVDASAASLWMTTEEDVSSPSGANGLDSWDGGSVLSFDDPNLTYDPSGTDGTLNNVFNLDDFVQDGDSRLDAVHYVGANITVGSNSVPLQSGDILLSSVFVETLVNSDTSTLDVTSRDVFIFRPDSLSDYSLGGTFIKLIDGADLSVEIEGITLVETTTTVGTGGGATTLNPGDFLFTDRDNSSVIYRLQPGVLGGAATNTGTITVLVDGTDLGINQLIHGVELVESDVIVGDRTLTSGQLLISLYSDDVVSGTSVSRSDIFILNVTDTGTTTTATAEAFFDGGDIGFNTWQESPWAVSLVPNVTNNAPSTSGIPDVSINENSGFGFMDLKPHFADAEDLDTDLVYTIVGNTNPALFNSATIVSGSTFRLDYGEDLNGTSDITIRATDTGGLFVESTFTVTVNPVNDAPVLDLDADDSLAVGLDFASTWTEGAGPVVIADSDAALSDVDSANLSSLTVTITNLLDGTAEVLAANTSGTSITANYVSATGVLTLSGSDSVANYQQVLRTVTYDSTADAPDPTARVITFTASDGADASSLATTTLTVAATNDDPTNAGLLQSASVVTEDVSSPINLSFIEVSDVDAGTDALTMTLTTSTGGNLSAAAGTGITIGGNGTGVLTLSGNLTDLNAYLDTVGAVTYLHSVANTSGFGADTIQVDVTDNGSTGAGGGGTITFGTFNVDITAVNDAPIAADDPGSFSADVQALSPLSYWRLGETSGTSAVDLGSAGVTGTYSGASQGESDAINGDPDAAAGFTRTELDSIEIPHDDAYLLDEGTIQLWFNANDLAQVQAVFSKDSSGFDTGGHLSMRLLTDGSLSVRLQSTTTDYHVSSLPGSVAAGSWHQVAFSFGSGGMELYLDGVLVDTDAYTGGLGTSSGGIGNYEPITIGANNWVSGDGVSTPLEEYFDGRIDEVAIFGSPLSGSQIKQLSGSALQNYTLDEDGSLAVPASEGVLVNDFDADGDALTAILVSGPSNAASFVLNSDGSFNYTPTPDFNGTDTFTYKSNDGTSDSNVATVTITVNSISDAPTAANNTVSTNEDIDYVFTAADFNFSDVDAGDTLQQVQITTLPTAGTLKLAGVDVTLNQVITVADINAGNLTFTPVADQNGAGYDSFEFKVSDTAPPGTVLSSFAAPVVNSMSGLAFDGTNVWLTGQSTNTIYELDSLGNVISSFAGPATNPTGLTFDGTNLWVVDRDMNTIYELDTLGNVISSFATPGTDSRGLTWDGTNLWLVEGTGSQIYELTTTGTVVSSFAWPDDYMRGITFDGTSLWVADQNDQLIYELNTAGSVLSSFAAPSTGAAGITFDGQEFWHADADVDTIYQLAGPGSPVFSAAAYTMTIDVTAVSDAPVLGTNALTISEGGTVILSAANLGATDVDTADPSLTFTVSSVSGGQFELVASPGVPITSFTQAQITSGAVQFVHGGGEAAPSYDVTVDDGALNDGPSAASISFTNQNDAPVLGTNALTISEGGTVILSAANLAATDVDTADPSLSFTVSSVTGGQFELVASPGVPITSFTQAQITSGAVQFVHGGGEATPSYDVTVDDGALNDGPSAASISFTNQNDAPVLGTNALTILEGGTVILSAANLAATDVDTADPSLSFTVSSVTGGQFELVASPGVPITSFTQAQITSGAVQFVHDGGETAPSYDVTVDDGALSDGPTAASISFTNQNEAPVLGANALTISEGGTVILSAANLAATDVDTADPSLTFTVSSISGGQFELVASPGVPITSFTQAQITSGAVQFVHDGGEAAPSYDVTVDDGALNDGPSAASISFTNQNDAPVLGTNALTISEGGTVVLSAANLGATDVDTADPSLTFTVSSVTSGQFELVASPGVPITSFTQAQITSGAVQFVHDGGETAPSYDVTVDDGALNDGPSAASISFTNQNDAPVLGNNALTISEGGTVILSAANLAATDVDTADPSLTFTVSSVSGGQFELVASPGVPITSFTQAQITSGAVQFVHGGGEGAPSYDVTVDDGALNDGPSAASISFTNQNDAPVLGTNALTILEGGTVILSAANLAATDVDTADPSLSFTVSSVTGGQFELVASPGVPITSFTQAQVTSGAVQFVHGGGEGAPSYDITVDDGALNDGPSAASISFTNQNDAPVLGTNALTISEGGTVILSAANLGATDVDTADPSLSFTVSSVAGGQFELVASPGVPITSFTQAQITSGAVQFVHDGGEGAPSYDVTVDDGVLNDGPSAASISFTNQNDAPVLGTNALTISEGGTVILSAANLAATDADTADPSLSFTVSSVTGGQFELVASPGAPITSFTQAQVTSGAVQFVHGGGEGAPSYDVTVGDGALSDGASAASISFTNQNDAPVLGTNALTILEGGTVILSAANLAATDVDTADPSLSFTVSSVTGGQFELVASPGVPITSFTQAQLTSGAVQFVHGGGEGAPSYDVTVDDGALNDGPSAASISFTNQNDAPVLGTNALTISEGGTVILSAANLGATDVDTADSSLSFTVSGVTGGQFELVVSPGVPITSFTQAQITSGAVQFVHDGGEAAPSYDVTVDDGALNDGPNAAAITYTGQNDAPVLGTNALTIAEGGTVILSAANLAATDVDTADPSLTFTVSSVTGGQFELVASPGVPITSFTQAQITSGAVQFVHGGGEGPPSYDVTVDDGALNDGPFAASITFTNQNDAPVLGTNALTISEGGTVVLSAANLSATDVDTAGPSLSFTVSSVTGGQFELVVSPGVPITSFTQAQITSGAVQFVHDGGEAAPSYDVTVDDGALNDGPNAAAITYTGQNDAPVLGTNALTIAEGGTVILSAANLAATDVDTADPSLTFTVSSVTGGQFELVASLGVPITSFTQAQITSGAVQFVHGGGEGAPSYDVTVDDGVLNDGPSAASISFTNQNDAPVLGTNALTISEGGTVILSAANLGATDVDTAGPSLSFTVSSVTGGQFELVASPGVPITSFTQAQLTSGAVQFVHGGGEAAPSYDVTVDDGALSDGPQAAAISFTNQNDAPVLGTNALSINEGGTVVLSAASLAATDVDTADPSLSFSVSSVTGGQFELVASPGVPITSFTQAQVTSGAVQFVHDGGEGAPSYDVTVDDGSLSDGPSSAAISFTNQNDAPVLGTNALTIAEGGTVILSAASVTATDVDTADPSLSFTVSSVTGGQFELVASPGVSITSFTQAQVTSGAVQFVHDAGEAAPAYDVTVDDGALNAGPSAASISFTNQNDAPVLGTNALTIAEGGTVILSAGELAAVDVDDADPSLGFTVSSVSGGQFEFVASPGVSITGFTQAQVTSGAVRFAHDGGETAPSYDVTVDDGTLSDGFSAAISFSNQNDAPVLGTNALTIADGGTAILSTANITATDVDDVDASLSFTVSAVTEGQFELVTTPGLAITSFTQAQVTAGDVQFVHAGTQTAPGYSVMVSDGVMTDSGTASTTLTAAPLTPPPADDATDQESETDEQEGETDRQESSTEESTDPGAPEIANPVPSVTPEPKLDSIIVGPGHLVQPLDDGAVAPTANAGTASVDDGRAQRSARPARAQLPHIDSARLIGALDQMGLEMNSATDASLSQQETVISTIEGMTIVASAGLIAAIVRSGSLIALAASSLPLWTGVDPLAILYISDEERDRRARDVSAAQEEEDREYAVGQLLDRA